MVYDLSDIMRTAWVIARQELWSRRLPQSELRRLFPNALLGAWKLAKTRAAYQARMRAEAEAMQGDADGIRNEVVRLENKTRLSPSDFARLDALKACLRNLDRLAA